MKKAYNIKFTTNRIVMANSKEHPKDIFDTLYASKLSRNPTSL